ncbi:MAG: hypothetical protein QMD32_02905 [Smithellaceae bacterium]|nr:hypothetical protein [Smithellaceae bacterium]
MITYSRMLIFIVMILIITPSSHGQEKCVDSAGEAIIINNDTPSARTEAVARAKWDAIEQVVGIEVKAQSLVQNFVLVDDVIKTQVGGVVKSFRLLGQETKQDVLSVRINACIEPAKAREAVSSLALNNSLAIFITTRKAEQAGQEGATDTSIFSESLIGKLTDQGYRVIDVAPTQALDAAEIDRAVKTGSTLAVRSLMYKFLSNLLIIGSIEPTISTKKGEQIGYGISMPFNNVTLRLNYRIVAKNAKTSQMEIMTAGTAQGRGMAGNLDDALARAMADLFEKAHPNIMDKVASYIQGNSKKVAVQIKGVSDLDTNLEIKGVFQQLVWVTGVEEKKLGEFIVSYPENTLYLANSIKQKGRFNVLTFSPYSLNLEYIK